jgi:lysophospholipase L1-like esterase
MSGLTTGELVGLFDPITKAAIGVIDAGGKEQIGLGGAAVGDATAIAKGIVQLAGDLGGTAGAPTVPGLANKADVLPEGLLISGATMTRALHVNRPLKIGGSAASTQAFTNVAGTTGLIGGDSYYLRNTGTGTFTATGSITAPLGFKLIALPDEVFSADYDSTNDVWKSTLRIASTGGGTFAATTGLPQTNASLAPSLGIKPAMGSLWQPFYTAGALNVGTNAGAGRGQGQQIMAPFPFMGVRLLYSNPDTASAMTINRSIAAPCANQTDNATALTWSEVTFNGGSATATIPAAVVSLGKIIPGFLISDFMPIISLVRTDGGTFPVLRTRTHHPDSTNITANSSYTALNADAANPGFITASETFSTIVGNLSTTAGTVTAAGSCNSPVGALFYYSAGCYELASFGDSLTIGTTTTSNYLGYPMRAAYYAYAQGKRLTSMVEANNGMTHATYSAIALAFLAKYSPTFLSITSWSPNDAGATTQVVLDAMWSRILNLVQVCKSQGVVPIVLTPFPNASLNATLMNQQIARVLALPAWVIKIDANTILNNGTVGAFNAAYQSDGVHTNDAGHGALGQALLNSLPI